MRKSGTDVLYKNIVRNQYAFPEVERVRQVKPGEIVGGEREGGKSNPSNARNDGLATMYRTLSELR